MHTARLDSIIEKADFIKIDVEGTEMEVLEGTGTLKTSPTFGRRVGSFLPTGRRTRSECTP